MFSRKLALSIFLLSLVAGFGVGRAHERDHEHDYSETKYVTTPCCLYDEEYDCQETDDGTRICKSRCASWGRKMKEYEKCKCGARRLVSATECSSNL